MYAFYVDICYELPPPAHLDICMDIQDLPLCLTPAFSNTPRTALWGELPEPVVSPLLLPQDYSLRFRYFGIYHKGTLRNRNQRTVFCFQLFQRLGWITSVKHFLISDIFLFHSFYSLKDLLQTSEGECKVISSNATEKRKWILKVARSVLQQHKLVTKTLQTVKNHTHDLVFPVARLSIFHWLLVEILALWCNPVFV